MNALSPSYARVHARVPPGYVKYAYARHRDRGQKILLADVSGRLERLGVGEVLTVTQDPTDATRLTAVTRQPLSHGLARAPTAIGAYGRSPSPRSDGIVTIGRVEPVMAPPGPLARPSPPTTVAWDHGLNADEIAAVENALLHEPNPRHLRGLAATLEPQFPVAASLLDAKADLVEAKVLADEPTCRKLAELAARCPCSRERLMGIARERDRLQAYVQSRNLPPAVVRDEVKRLAVALLPTPSAEGRPPGPYPTPITTPLPAALPLARALRRDVVLPTASGPKTLSILCPTAAAIAFPPDVDDAFVSPQAVKLALGAQKPEMSLVARERHVPDRLRALPTGSPQLEVGRALSYPETMSLRARQQMERSNQAIERRRWVDWQRLRALSGLPRAGA